MKLQFLLMLLLLSMIDDLQGGSSGLVPLPVECKAKGGGSKGPVDTGNKKKKDQMNRIQKKEINGSLKEILTRLLLIQGFPLLLLLVLCMKNLCSGSEN